ncbi:hypothetical protein, partial [Bacillus thuringiensis]|uniref:hypothetical protein n=1 Tax=Bacillus thuringiensis TaxID=1428 RepID=UPI0011A5B325
MVRLNGSGKQGLSPSDAEAKPTETKKRKQPPKSSTSDFSQFADLGDLKTGKEKETVVEGEQQETTPTTTKTEEQVIESKQEVVSIESEESVETPTENPTEEPKQEKESESDSDGNNDKEPVEGQEEGSEG